MPASRPQHTDQHAKRTTAAPTPSCTSKNNNNILSVPSDQRHQHHQHHEQHQQELDSVVSSPQSSPTNPHPSRFIAPQSSLTLASFHKRSLPDTDHVTDTDSNTRDYTGNTGASPDLHAISVRSVPTSASPSSSASGHSHSNHRNVAISCVKAQPQPRHPSQAHHQTQSQALPQSRVQSPSQMIALNEARVFAQQLLQQQLHQQQYYISQQNQQPQHPSQQQGSHLDTARYASLTPTGARSITGPMMSARGSTAASTIGGGAANPVQGGTRGNADEPMEQTLLLVRPVWVLDQDAAACSICARTFNAVRRKVKKCIPPFPRMRLFFCPCIPNHCLARKHGIG
ncbi:hypothetical protein BC939DRAFT_196745 [Gamsiella multidivaricata]|uniref:uncharacterized protein n=1 Tax=Gamsiella multidivaricata TaxID=101098 RepID=UPI00221F9740|nr:uncharacterized protein BC939DRAFT_196745 [Gamsiella multidivaricata]KAI7822052.1 hypothetical protein BC939DRAFT_196745 [Gamsiella multidivaricata]